MSHAKEIRKILVTGNAGSGKTTLSRKLADLLRIQAYSLDKIVWQTGWKKTPRMDRDRAISKLIAKDSWVIDGVSDTVMGAADLVIFLDFSRTTCFRRVLQRTVKHLFRTRPEFSHTTPEVFVLPKVLKIIWRFPGHVRPKILAFQQGNIDRFRHIDSQEKLNKLLEELTILEQISQCL